MYVLCGARHALSSAAAIENCALLHPLVVSWLTPHSLSSSLCVLVHPQVQINNTEALEFYKKQGFENVGQIDNYYKKIEPPHCFVLSKKFVHVNMGGRGGTLD